MMEQHDYFRFKPETLHAWLTGGVLRNNATAPRTTSQELVQMAMELNRINNTIFFVTVAWKDSLLRRQKLLDAMQIVLSELPALRDEVEAATRQFRDDQIWILFAQGGDAMSRIDALGASIVHAVEHPLLFDLTVGTPREAKWTLFATRIEEIFHQALARSNPGGNLSASAYRFMEKVIPELTGETPTFESIQTTMKKIHRVNRENEESSSSSD